MLIDSDWEIIKDGRSSLPQVITILTIFDFCSKECQAQYALLLTLQGVVECWWNRLLPWPFVEFSVAFGLSHLLVEKSCGIYYFPSIQPLLCNDMGHVLIQSIAILNRKIVYVNNSVGVKVLIEWVNLGIDNMTWEYLGYITHRFPKFIT